MAKKKITYEIGYTIDKNDLSNITRELARIENLGKLTTKNSLDNSIKTAANSAKQLSQIIDNSWNDKLDKFDLTKFNESIKKSYGNLSGLKNSLNGVDTNVFDQLTNKIIGTNLQLKQSSKLLDKMSVTMANTVRFAITSRIVNNLADSISGAYDFSVKLDTSLNDIRIVTGKTADEMARFAVEANKAAKTLGASTRDYTEGALIYYQQGLSDAEATARTETTLKAANVTRQSAQEVSEQLTAVWNGYRVQAEETELYVDKLAAVAASTAADLEELSTGMSKVASSASLMGVDIDQLNAQLSTIVSVSRQAPESVGTALRTIYARMADIEAGVDEETTLGSYTKEMAELGVNVLDADGKLRDMGEVIEEIGNKWKGMSREQQIALSQSMAGTRQYNNLLSLFDNWDQYTKALETSRNAAGTLQKQQDIYMESTRAHLQQLRDEAERTYAILFDQDTIKIFADLLGGALSKINDYISGIGGGLNAITSIGMQIANIFNKQISQSVVRTSENIKGWWNSLKEINSLEKIIKDLEAISNSRGRQGNSSYINEQARTLKNILSYRKNLTTEEYNELAAAAERLSYLKQEKEIDEENLKKANAAGITTREDAQVRVKKIAQERYEWSLKTQEVYESIGKLTKENNINEQEREEIASSVLNLDKNNVELQKISNQIKETGKLSEQDINTIKELKVSKEKDYGEKLKQNLAYHKAIKHSEEEYTTKRDYDIEQIGKYLKAEEERYKKLNRTSKIITGITAGIQGITAAAGAWNKATEDNISQAEKNKAVWEGTLGVGSAIANAIYPGSGFIVQGIGAVISSFIDWEGETIRAARRMKEELQAVTQTYQSIKTSYDNLLTSLSDYQDAKLGLNNLVAGTEEWEASITRINDQVLSLMNVYPELAKYIETSGNALSISPEGIEYLKQAQSIAVENAKATLYQTQFQNNDASRDLIIKELRESIENELPYYQRYTDRRGDSVKTISTELVEALIKATENNPNLFNAEAPEALSEFLKEYKIANETSIKAFQKNAEAVTKAKKSIDALTESNTILEKTLLGKGLSNLGISGYQDSSYKNLINSSIYKNIFDRDVFEDYYKENYSDSSSLTDEKAQKEYAKLMGYEWVSNDNDNKGTYKINGVSQQLDDAIARRAIAEQQYLKDNESNIKQKTEEYISNIEELQKNLDSFLDLDNEQLINFVSSLSSDSTLDLTDLTQEEIEKFREFFNSDDFLRYIETLGYGTIEQIRNDFTQSINDAIQNPNISAYYGKASRSLSNAGNILEITSSLRDKGYNELSDEEKQRLEVLESQYEKLGEIQNKNSHEYLEVLREIKETEEDNAKKDLENAQTVQEKKLSYLRQRLSESTDLEDIKNLRKQIEEVLEGISETKYKIKLQIETDLGSDVNDAFGIADELDNIREKLKTDLEYTYDEAQELIAKGYGELFTNAQETANNTIKVQRDVAKAYIEGQQSELKASKETKIAQLENEKILLQAQKNALISRLSALRDAANATTATDAAATLERVKNADKEYEEKTKALQEFLNRDADSATESQKINAELYNALGDMYKTDSENEQEANKKATDIQKENISNKLKNVGKLLNAYKILAKQIAQTPLGKVISDTISSSGLTGGVSSTVDNINAITSSIQKAGEIKSGSLNLTQFFNESGSTEEYRNTINKLIQETEAQIRGIDGQIGAADAGIAALKSSYIALDKLKGNLGKGSGKSGSESYLERLEGEADRYHQINQQIKLVTNSLNKLEKEKDKLFGKDLIGNLNNQIANLDKQTQNYTEKIKIANGELGELKGTLAAQGVTFNADGTIGNYSQIYMAQLANVNGLIDRYNSLSEDAKKSYKDVVEAGKKNFEDFKKDLDRYDELVTSFIPDLEAQIQDNLNKIIEQNIEKFNMSINLRLDMADAERDWNKFKKQIIDDIEDDDILGNALAGLTDFSSYYKDGGNGVLQANARHVNDILNQLYQMDQGAAASVYGDNRNQALEDLEKYYKQLISDLKNLDKLQDEIHQSYLDMMNEAQDKFKEQVNSFELVSELINHDINLISLVYGKEAYSKLSAYYDRQENNYNKQLDFQRQQVEFWRNQMDTLDNSSKEWDSARQKWKDAIKQWNDLVEKSIKNIQDEYLNTINAIFQALNGRITDGKGLNYVNEQWNLINKNADQYLDNINSLYEVQKLENKYLEAIDNSDSVGTQRELKAIMDSELKNLRERDKLTEYDIERANKRYEIALKQMALAEAQKNKSSMRLRRDSQGNYRYEYVADQDNVNNIQQELNDMYNSLYNFDKEKYNNNLNELYSIWSEFQNKMAEAAQINDPTERAERELLLQEQYGELINGIVEQNASIRNNLYDSAFTDLSILYDEDLEHFKEMSEAEKNTLMNDLIPYWTSGVQTMADAFAGEGGFLGVCKDAFDELNQATKDYENSLNEIQKVANVNFDEIGNGIDKVIGQSEELVKDNNELTQTYNDQLDAIQGVIDQLDTLIDKYGQAKEEAIAASKAAYEYWAQQQDLAAKSAEADTQKMTSNEPAQTTPTVNNTPAPAVALAPHTSQGDGILSIGDRATFTGRYYNSSYGENPSGNLYSGVLNGIVIDRILNNRDFGIHIKSADGRYPDLGWVKKSQLSGYDTGGYTGTWGSDGRLALLHQKELVLNQSDTKNLLDAVGILRQITNSFNHSFLSQMANLSSNSAATSMMEKDKLEQYVHIDASFPNVTNSQEIENAFDNLLNVAVQRINR